jgi:hypothetical protein
LSFSEANAWAELWFGIEIIIVNKSRANSK